MKKPQRIGIIIALILLLTITSQGLAQVGLSEEETVTSTGSDMEAQVVVPSWSIGWLNETASTNVGAYASVAYNPADGLPYVSFYDSINGNLMLASPVTLKGSGNCGTGNNWWCRLVDTAGDVGRYSSIAFGQGLDGSTPVWKIGISYYDATNHAIKFAEWKPVGSSGNWSFEGIAGDAQLGVIGPQSSLKYTSGGTPMIAFHSVSGTTGIMGIASYVGWDGNCGLGSDYHTWSCQVLDSGAAATGQYVSLDISWDDQIYMAYYDGTNANLKYAYSVGFYNGNCGFLGVYQCETVDGTAVGQDAGLFTSILAPKSSTDTARIAYYDKTNGTLKYAYRTVSGANCGGGAWFCGNVDSIGAGIAVPIGISMRLDHKGYPIIAYMNAFDDASPSALKIARPAAATGLASGNCGNLLPGNALPYWQCDTLDSAIYGAGYVDVAAYTSVDVSPHGQITIPYFESDSYDGTNSLKVAQSLPTFADVPFNYWAHDWIESFYFAGITTGCGTNPLNYCPERNVTRAEMAVFILRAKDGLFTPTPAETGMFADVPFTGKEWMRPWIEQFYMEGITTGCGANPMIYCPERNVTRAEMAVFILRASHAPGWQPPVVVSSTFADVPVTGKDWMMPWIEAFYNTGLTTGCGYNAEHELLYCPERNVTRAEMATFIDRAFDIP